MILDTSVLCAHAHAAQPLADGKIKYIKGTLHSGDQNNHGRDLLNSIRNYETLLTWQWQYYSPAATMSARATVPVYIELDMYRVSCQLGDCCK